MAWSISVLWNVPMEMWNKKSVFIEVLTTNANERNHPFIQTLRIKSIETLFLPSHYHSFIRVCMEMR